MKLSRPFSSDFFISVKNSTGRSIAMDFMAGLTVAFMLVPQGMAYALLAGLPPIYGLYAGLVPLIIYPLFGTSPHLSVGPVALVSIILISGLSVYAEPFSTTFVQLAILCSLIAGLIQVLLAVFRMGFLVNFLSDPVISGFTSAAAIIIAVSQVKHVFGIDSSARTLMENFVDLYQGIWSINPLSLALGLGSMFVLILLKKWKKSIPGALVVVSLGILLVFLNQWTENELALVGQVPSGLPKFSSPIFSLDSIALVFPLSLIICLISFIESLAIAKTIAERQSSRINPNRELLGLGLAKVIGAFFQSFPNTGSFSRSVINEQAGAKTGLSSIFTALIVAFVLIFLTDLFALLPKAILASIVIVAILGLFDFKGAKRLFYTHKKDFWVLFTTFIITIIFGVQIGVIAGVGLSLLFIIRKASKPHYAVLGRLEGTDTYRNIQRYSDAIIREDTLIIRYDDDLFFGNAEHFHDAIVKEISKRDNLKNLVLDMSLVLTVDSTALKSFKKLIDFLEAQNIRLFITGPKGPLRDQIKSQHMFNWVVEKDVRMEIFQAMDEIEKNT